MQDSGIVLGINAHHGDSAACLLRNGELIAAVEEERFRRIKHWAGLPTEAIRYCLQEARIGCGDVDHIALNRDPRANNLRRLSYLLLHRPSFSLVLDRLRNIRKVVSLEEGLRGAFPGETFRAKVHHVEHHRAHLASAFLVSPFAKAVCVSVDGFGDFASTSWGLGEAGGIRIDKRIYFPHSLGVFYTALTQYLGFPHYGDEYKVMGLAAYGRPLYLDAMRRIVLVRADGEFRLDLRYFRHSREHVAHRWEGGAPGVGFYSSPALEQLLGRPRRPDEPVEQRHMDLAASVQAAYEEALFALLNALYRRYDCSNLALAGGCAMNSVANGKIYDRTPYRKLYLPAAAGDAGGAIGAAFATAHELQPFVARFAMPHAYWGPGAGDVESLLREKAAEIDRAGCRFRRVEDRSELCVETAQAISEGKVVGWFQGRLEWGPRALGNRSIVCDPRRAEMRDILNLKIKRRESFRPFAPSILREAVADWFETDDDVPFMMQVFQIRAEKRLLIPAVTHVDGSGRLQTVHRDTNPVYHQLISEFCRITGVPLVLNTSFNENEPIVCYPEEALDCFLRTKMDLLVLESYAVERF